MPHLPWRPHPLQAGELVAEASTALLARGINVSVATVVAGRRHLASDPACSADTYPYSVSVGIQQGWTSSAATGCLCIPEGCYKNDPGKGRVNDHAGCRTVARCRALAAYRDHPFFGLEWPQGCPAGSGQGHCVTLQPEQIAQWVPVAESDQSCEPSTGGSYRVVVSS